MATIKQKKAAKKTIENYGNVSKSMREVGYSKNTAKNPKVLTESNGWKELMKEYIPDKLLAEKHKELLNKKIKGELDPNAVGKGLDMGYKLKGKYTPEKVEHSGEIATIVTEAELAEYIKWRKEK